MQTILELFLCEMDGRKIRYHRYCHDISTMRHDPERVLPEILSLLEVPLDHHQGCAHSTSWRYEEGQIVLTYLLWLKNQSLDNLPTRLVNAELVAPAEASGPLRPRPETIEENQVLVHGLRHLHYLVKERREPYLSAAFRDTGAMQLLSNFRPGPAGRLVVN